VREKWIYIKAALRECECVVCIPAEWRAIHQSFAGDAAAVWRQHQDSMSDARGLHQIVGYEECASASL
jgi:hypothetical protein